MIKRLLLSFVVVGLLAAPMVARAALITFTAIGDPNVSGFVQFDSLFNGTNFQSVQNTAITDLFITVFGAVFDLGDVANGAYTYINSSGPIPIIVNGGGFLANNGAQAISFFPDGGFGGTALDGDASLFFSVTPPFVSGTSLAVRWEASAVPEPATLVLLGLGLAGLAAARRRRRGHAQGPPAEANVVTTLVARPNSRSFRSPATLND